MKEKEKTILEEAKKAKFKPSMVEQIFIFILIFVITQVIAGLVPTGILILDIVKNIEVYELVAMDANVLMNELMANLSQEYILATIYCSAAMILGAIIYCVYIEKRSFYSMGVIKKKAIKNYLVGLLIGFTMIGATFLLIYVTKGIEFQGINPEFSVLMGVVFLIGFIIQGASEEILMRGYFMVSLANKKTIPFAIIVNSIVFAFLHIANPGVTILGIFNVVLIGIFASLLVVKTNNIWLACGMHTMWNFMQGCIFNFRVSGMNITNSLFSISLSGGKEIINGGSFGLEGGIITTIITGIAIGVLVYCIKKKDNQKAMQEEK